MHCYITIVLAGTFSRCIYLSQAPRKVKPPKSRFYAKFAPYVTHWHHIVHYPAVQYLSKTCLVPWNYYFFGAIGGRREKSPISTVFKFRNFLVRTFLIRTFLIRTFLKVLIRKVLVAPIGVQGAYKNFPNYFPVPDLVRVGRRCPGQAST